MKNLKPIKNLEAEDITLHSNLVKTSGFEKKDLNKSIQSMDQYLAALNNDRKSIFISNLIGGIAWGLGSVIGATIIVGILGIIVINTKKVPIIGDVIKIVTEQIQNGTQQLKK